MVGKFAVVIGPALIGGVGLLFRGLGFGSNAASRVSITSIALLFIAGGVLLFFVDERRGKEQVKFLQ
jgi:UMF1 family MFS transporter